MKSIAIGILRGCPLGASMRLEEDGGALLAAGDRAGGVLPRLPAWLPAIRLAALLLDLAGVLARLAGALDTRPTTALLRGGSTVDTRTCTGAELRACEGLVGEAGGGVEEGTDTR